MGDFKINEKTVFTQSGSAEPAMGSTITGIPAAGVTGVLPAGVTGGSGLTALGTVASGNLSNTNIVYPAGHVVQCVSMNNNTWYQSTSLAVVTCTNYTKTIDKQYGATSKIVALFTYTANTFQGNSTTAAQLNLYWVRTAPTSANFWDGYQYIANESNDETYLNFYATNGGQFEDTSTATGNHTYVATITGGSSGSSAPRGAVANAGTQSITLMEVAG